MYGCCPERKHLVDRSGFDDLTELHHRDTVCDARDHRKVVADEQQRGALRLEVGEQVKNLRLNGDIKRRRRFVGDQQWRVRGDG